MRNILILMFYHSSDLSILVTDFLISYSMHTITMYVIIPLSNLQSPLFSAPKIIKEELPGDVKRLLPGLCLGFHTVLYYAADVSWRKTSTFMTENFPRESNCSDFFHDFLSNIMGSHKYCFIWGL